MDRVTTIIPLYNHEKYISRAVESVLAQGDILRELIVIDDGSKDRSAEVMNILATRDPRITFLQHENRGAHATINRGLEMASGEFVTILNSDDYFAKGRFSALAHCLDLDEGSDFASSGIAFVDGQEIAIENQWFRTALDGFKHRRDVAVSLIDANYLMTTSNFFMRRSLIQRMGYFAPLRYAHDLEFALRCAAHGVRFCFIDRPLMHYRFHATNTISENHASVRLEWALCAAIYLRLKYPAGHRTNDPRPGQIRAILEKHGLSRVVDLMVAFLDAKGIDRVDDELIAHVRRNKVFAEAA